MSGSNFGNIFKISTWGESHGVAIGVVIDGCPAGIEVSGEDIQKELDRRRPGQSKVTTSRGEDDKVEILSGVFEGKTTGTPISLMIRNKDSDSSKYKELKNKFRPGHADFTYMKKYGLRDHNGGGRSSGRETAARVAAGAVARKVLKGVSINAYAKQIGRIIAKKIDLKQIEKNDVRCADKDAVKAMEGEIMNARADNDSVGGIVEIIISGSPVGLGDPVFDKLDADLAKALMSIGAVKGIEMGAGFDVACMRGSEDNDQINAKGFVTNNSGGILGGISTGEDIIIRIAVKPTASIAKEQNTIDVKGKGCKIKVEGRHDPCIVPRIIPVAEAMVALVLADKMLMQRCVK